MGEMEVVVVRRSAREAMAALRELGGCAYGCYGRRRRSRNLEMRCGMVWEGAGGDNGRLWLVSTTWGRMPVTRGQFPCHAAASA